MASSPGPGADIAVHRSAIVGGGAGGLALATRLGDTLGREGPAQSQRHGIRCRVGESARLDREQRLVRVALRSCGRSAPSTTRFRRCRSG
jgi:hypothetical protein